MRVEPVELQDLHNKDNLMQSRFWGRAKWMAGKKPLAFRLVAGQAETELLVLLTGFSGGCYGYLPLGPDIMVPPEERGLFLEELSEKLARQLPRDCLFIRYDLPWETPYEAGDEGEYDTADGRPTQRVRELRMNFGTRHHALRKAPTDIQPADTLLLSICRNEESLLAGMKAKTRYNIRLGARKGVKVHDASPRQVDQWYSLYRETAKRKHISLHGYEHFAVLFRAFQRFRTPNLDLHLLLAEKENEALGGIILALHGNTATYLYGATGDRGRNLMPAYRLQWEAIRLARKQNCTVYDFFGIPPTTQVSHPMHGLLRFKRGFGGTSVHRQGCWDYPLREEEYTHFAEMERLGGGYHLQA